MAATNAAREYQNDDVIPKSVPQGESFLASADST